MYRAACFLRFFSYKQRKTTQSPLPSPYLCTLSPSPFFLSLSLSYSQKLSLNCLLSLPQAQAENQRLEEQLREEKFLTQEAEEMKNMLTQKKLELESFLGDSETRAEELEELNQALQAEKTKLQSTIQQLDEQ